MSKLVVREIQETLLELVRTYPVVTITGPRQAGKTTLTRMALPGYSYSNLEHPETRLLAQQDPKSFFSQHKVPLIIDEIQRVPELLSYIQVDVDEKRVNGMYVLTGSQQLNLNASITQTLAGRTALVTLLPFSIKELEQVQSTNNRDKHIFEGFMPRVHDQKQNPSIAYGNYLQTYVERDVRQLFNLKDLALFETFLRLIAGRVGQLINLSSLASDTGVSATTISNWLSILEASFIIYRLQPYYENLGKRVIKSPKLYFTETGLLSHLLGIEKEQQVLRDPLLGNIFENMVVMDAVKARLNKGLNPNLYFFRDSHHNEVDLLYRKGSDVIPIEIKASMTFNTHLLSQIVKFQSFTGNTLKAFLVYGGEKSFLYKDSLEIVGYNECYRIFC